MIHPDYEFDEIADKIFYPAYDEITDDIIRETGIVHGKLLDVGCGGGHLGYSMLKKTDMTASFLDIKSAAIEVAERRAQELYMEERTDFHVGNVEQLPFDDNEFALVISRGSMPFWKNQESAFREMFRVIQPGGFIYVGGGLGSPKTQEMIRQKMHEAGYFFFGERQKDVSMVLPDQEYRQLFETFDCTYQIVHSKEKGHWICIHKNEKEQ